MRLRILLVINLTSQINSVAVKFLATEKCESLTDKEIIENCNAAGCCFNMTIIFVKPITKIHVKLFLNNYIFKLI